MIDNRTDVLITVRTTEAIPLVTEAKEKRIAILKNQQGETILLKSHQLNKEMSKFLEKSGLVVEYTKAPAGRRGKTEINGVAVRITAINHTNYDAGAYIRVPEEDATTMENTRHVLRYLRQKGIDVERYCSATKKGTSCLGILNE